jgi:hypothetical protein
MKKAIMFAVLALAAVGVAQAQDVTGDWVGDLPRDLGSIRIVVHVTKAADGSLKATLDSPDQPGMMGMPADSISLEGKRVKFKAGPTVSYEGTVKNATISGTWIQNTNRTQLDFTKTTTPIKLDHPSAAPSDIDGTWDGTADMVKLADTPARGKLHLIFHLKNTGDGIFGSFDAPDMNIKDYPIVGVTRKGSSIKIMAPQVGGFFVGKINKELTVMSGDWSEEHTHALTLKKTAGAPADAAAAPNK